MQLFGKNILVKQDFVKEQKNKSGIIIASELYNLPELSKREVRFGTIKEVGGECEFYKNKDRVILKNSDGFEIKISEEKFIMVAEKQVLCKVNKDNTYSVAPNNIIVKIKKKDRNALFSKTIKRDDGSEVELFINVEASKIDERSSGIFVSVGEVYEVGSKVKNVLKGDTAILNYNVDNDDSLIIGYDGEDKLVVLNAVTTFHSETLVVYQNRKTKRDQIVHSKGDYDEMSDLLGIIRNDKLIAREPYVFLNHQAFTQHIKTLSGIEYNQEVKVVEREILSVSEESTKKYGMKNGDTVLIDGFDCFEVKIKDGSKITGINDCDILCKKEMVDKLAS